MKKTRILIISFLILFGIISDGLALFLTAQQQSEVALPTVDVTDSLPLFVPAEILVTFRPNVTPDQIQAMNEAQGMTILEMNQGMGIYRLRVSRPVKEAVTLVQSQPFVEHARPNYILAVVGGKNITLLDMESVIEQINPFLRRIYTRNEAKETLQNSLVDYKLFSMVTREENLDKLPDVNRKINAAVEKTLAQAYTGKIGESLSVSEKELRDYYEFHLKEFQTPEQIKVRHIVVKTEEEAEMILEMIKAGAQFDMIAHEWSIDVTAKSSGELGWVGRERMPPALEKAAFALDKGEVSGIVKTGFGYHMFKPEGALESKPFQM